MDWDQASIARAEEARCALGISETATIAEPFAGGYLCYEAPGAWANLAIGVGLSAPPAPGEVQHLVDFYASRDVPARIELSPTVDRAWLAQLGEAGFVLDKFENVFARPLPPDEDLDRILPHGWPEGLSIRPARPDDPADVHSHAVTSESGFAGPDGPEPAAVALGERLVRHPRVVALLAQIDGEIVGAGTADVLGPVGGLFGLSVRPPWRRRGVQQALIQQRLIALRDRGCELATLSSEPGIATERNARRMGFQLAYTKVRMSRSAHSTGEPRPSGG